MYVTSSSSISYWINSEHWSQNIELYLDHQPLYLGEQDWDEIRFQIEVPEVVLTLQCCNEFDEGNISKVLFVKHLD